MKVFAIIITLLVVFFTPADALAWGPGTHLEIASNILRNHTLIAPAVAALINEYRFDFLYGNISADIVVGKNLMEELKHCHNWRFGRKLFNKAKNDSQRAFAYGYLTHLASDTVAHNSFIPAMMIQSFETRIHRHIYWELRFDAMADKKIWKIPETIEKHIHRENDRLLSSTLVGTPLSFRTNKTIFSAVINIHRIERWHRMIDMLTKMSRSTLKTTTREYYLNESITASLGFLNDFQDANCLALDPTGKQNLKFAALTRKKLKALKSSHGDWEAELEEALARVNYP